MFPSHDRGRKAFRTNPEQFDSLADAVSQSADEAQRLLEIFRLTAIQSPFNRDDIAQGFRLAQTFGFTTDQALGLTQIITDTAATLGLTGASIKELILPLGQIRSTGRASLEDLKQLAERGVPVFEALQEAAGLTGEELRKQISAGAISSSFAIEAIAESLGTQFAGNAKLATESLSGLLATFQDLRQNSLREFFQGTFDAIRPLAVELLSLENIDGTLAWQDRDWETT